MSAMAFLQKIIAGGLIFTFQRKSAVKLICILRPKLASHHSIKFIANACKVACGSSTYFRKENMYDFLVSLVLVFRRVAARVSPLANCIPPSPRWLSDSSIKVPWYLAYRVRLARLLGTLSTTACRSCWGAPGGMTSCSDQTQSSPP